MINVEREKQYSKKVYKGCGGKVTIILDIPDISSKSKYEYVVSLALWPFFTLG